MEQVQTALKLKLKPNKEQRLLLNQITGATSVIYNLALEYHKYLWETYNLRNTVSTPEDKKKRYQFMKENSSYVALAKLFKKSELTKLPEGCYNFLKDVPAEVVQQVLKDLDSALQNFFAGRAKFPKFKNSLSKKTFRSVMTKGVVKLNDKYLGVKIPGVGIVPAINPEKGNKKNRKERLALQRVLDKDTKINSSTISRDNLRNLYASIQYEYESSVAKSTGTKTVGLDLGITDSVSTSDGEFFNLPKMKKINSQIKRLQRKNKSQGKGRKRKVGSRSWNKTQKLIAKKMKKKVNIREDFQHKLSDKIVKENDIIIMEDLKLKNMTKSASGTLESPGTNVAQKAGLNRELLNQAMGGLRNKIQYKAQRRGKTFLVVDPKRTSQECFHCHHVDSKSRSGKTFKCVSCGFEIDADINGAINIKTRGLRGLAGREDLNPIPLDLESNTSMTPELEKIPLH